MSGLDQFLAAGPWPQRAGLRAVISLARRPRGRAVLRLLPQVDQIAHALLTMERYDDPLVSRPLGWDPVAIATRGGDLGRAEPRP